MLPFEDRELLTQTMVGLNIDPGTISSLMTSFDRAAEGVESDPVMPVRGASFGDSYTGGYRLGTNAEMAHQAVAEELKKVAAGLRAMGESVAEVGQDMQRTTEQSVATANRLTAATECMAAPTFSDNQCTLPIEQG